MQGLDIEGLLEERRGEEFEVYARAVNPRFVQLLRTIGFDVHWARAEGQYLYTSRGDRYLDMLAAYGMANVGRNHPRVAATLRSLIELRPPDVVQLGVGTLAALLAERLLELAPDSLGRVFFTNSGSESVEAAIKIGRAATRRSKVLSTERGFHGLTLGALSANGNPEFAEGFRPLVPGFSRVPFDDPEALERELSSEEYALFLVEPVQGKGVTIPSEGYLRSAQETCRRHGTLLCFDEVQTGFGRTGKMFALEHWGVEPDIMTVAKSLSGGYVPVGACLLRAEVFDEVFSSIDEAFAHSTTFQPNDMSSAAGLATLEVLTNESLPARAADLGAELLGLTGPLAGRKDVVEDVRGLGLMWAVEFSETAGRRFAYKLAGALHSAMFAQLVAIGLFDRHHILIEAAGHDINALKALPPLVIGGEDIRRFAAGLDEMLSDVEAHIPRSLISLGSNAARAAIDTRGP